MSYLRILELPRLLKSKSHFLFGPRGSGKTTLIRETLPSDRFPVINLLDNETRLRLVQNPSDLKRIVADQSRSVEAVVIDEVQKIPELLDEVHDLIESKGMKFLLTGSSARKLKRTGANLLGGRARMARMFPLVSAEMPEPNWAKLFQFGGLPGVVTSTEPWLDLRAYVDTYLNEEIQQEAQVRNLTHFSRFLKGAALQSSELLNYAGVASDSQVPESTVRSYYQILEDTLLGQVVEPFRATKKRKAIQTAKFYLFDTGVTHAILGHRMMERASPQYGRALEQWVFMELRAYLSYRQRDEELTFWRSVNGQEVDFLLGSDIAIEVKATRRVTRKHLKGLLALREEKIFKKFYLLSEEPHAHVVEGIECLPFDEFFRRLWGGGIF